MSQLAKKQQNLGLYLAVLACLLAFGVNVDAQKPSRSLRGIIYFTNNTPSNLSDFPVELFTTNESRTTHQLSSRQEQEQGQEQEQ